VPQHPSAFLRSARKSSLIGGGHAGDRPTLVVKNLVGDMRWLAETRHAIADIAAVSFMRLHPRNAIWSTGEHGNFNLCGSFTERQKTIGTDWLMLTSSITDIEAVAWSNALTSVVALLW
jgi:hypothetical protein